LQEQFPQRVLGVSFNFHDTPSQTQRPGCL
jgi:hypothetical protein